MKHNKESSYGESTHAGRVVDGSVPLPRSGTTPASRHHTVASWAIFGVIWVAISLNALIQWVMSDNFGPAPILPGDTLPPAKLIGLRILEVVSTLVVLQCLWQHGLKPWMAERRMTLEGMLLVGGIVGFTADAMLNLHHFLFAFNAHSVNLGVWTAFLPFYTGGPAHYAESLLWGFPMYVYFGITASLAGCAVIRFLRKQSPDITNARAFFLTYIIFCVGDFILENTIIRTTDAYMFIETYGPLTVFAGTDHQFPLYESFCAAAVSLAFTMLRQSALDDPNGVSFVERGAMSLPHIWQIPIRLLAVVGATGVFFICLYHIPFNWLSIIGDSVIAPPSYMLPGH
jgi:Spirocyclase AveC-like